MFPLTLALISVSFASTHHQRSSGSCFGSGSTAEVQKCGAEHFYCPVDLQCKERSLRCTETTVCINPNSGIEENCDRGTGNTGYNIKLGHTSLFKKKRLELEHQLISYRGFVYEFGCGYGVQILDKNDPNYKYRSTSVSFENVGTSTCTYEGVMIFTNKWSKKYSLFTKNCQHFAKLLSEYLMGCSHSTKRETVDLSKFADELIENCTECCSPDEPNAENAVQTLSPILLHLLVPFISLLVLQ